MHFTATAHFRFSTDDAAIGSPAHRFNRLGKAHAVTFLCDMKMLLIAVVEMRVKLAKRLLDLKCLRRYWQCRQYAGQKHCA